MKSRDTERSFLVIDQGSHASKALVYREDGELLAAAESAVETFQPKPGWVEHDAEALVGSVQAAICDALSEADLPTGTLRSAGMATQRSTVVAWDAVTGQALSPALSWRDTRHAEWLAGLELDVSGVRRITGLVPSPHYGASKLRWCLDYLPDVADAWAQRRLRLGPLSSFLTTRLVSPPPSPAAAADSNCFESPVVDPANASRTLLWDIGSRTWSPAMLEAVGIPKDVLPRPVPSRHDYGVIDAKGTRIPMTVCTGDQAAALFAAGPPDPDTVYVNLGTGAFIQRPGLTGPAPPGLLRSVCWQSGKDVLEVVEGTVNGAGAALSWLAASIGITEQVLIQEAPGWLDTIADPPLFANGIGGLGSPFWLPDAPVMFDREASVAGQTVAVLESIVFLIQTNLERMGTPTRIAVSGGLARLDGLCQRLADLALTPVMRLDDFEATARGVARLLADDFRTAVAGHDTLAPPLGPDGSRASRAIVFDPRSGSGMRTRFTRWQAFMRRLTGTVAVSE